MPSDTENLEIRVNSMLFRLLGNDMDYDLASKDFIKSVGEERAKAYVDMFASLDYEATKVSVPHIIEAVRIRTDKWKYGRDA